MSELLTAGYTYFLDLTDEKDAKILEEKGRCQDISEFQDKIRHYNIPDRRCPVTESDPTQFVRECVNILDAHQGVYIFCRGGHGRSALIAALVLIEKGVTNRDALRLIREAHGKRLVMEEKWRKMGAPQTTAQKSYVLSWRPSYLQTQQ
jgi:protein-tyrosine phosphatase